MIDVSRLVIKDDTLFTSKFLVRVAVDVRKSRCSCVRWREGDLRYLSRSSLALILLPYSIQVQIINILPFNRTCTDLEVFHVGCVKARARQV
jgi:hypothetical protein